MSCPVLSWPRVDFEAWATGAVAGDREALAALAGLPDSELQALIETLEAESSDMRAIEQRLARLEQAAAPAVTLYAFAQPGETMKQAIARQFPDGAPENATVVVYRFQGGRGVRRQ